MKNLLYNSNTENSSNKIDNLGESIKKNLNDEFSRNNIDLNATEPPNKMLMEEKINTKKTNELDTVKKNLDTHEFNKSSQITLNDFFKSNKKNKDEKENLNIKESQPLVELKRITDNNYYNDKKTFNNINNIAKNTLHLTNTLIDEFTDEDLDKLLMEALDDGNQVDFINGKTLAISPKSEISDEINWNDIDFSDINKEEGKNRDIYNNFKETNPVNSLCSLNILNNKTITHKKDPKTGINVTNNINIINNFNIQTKNIKENKVANMNISSETKNIYNKNDEKKEKEKEINLTIQGSKKLESKNIPLYNNPKDIIQKTERDFDEIDTENLFCQLRKLKENSNLDALFEKYNIDINIKKKDENECKFECPVCFEKEGK